MKKADRQKRADERAIQLQKAERKEDAMHAFIEECRAHMLPEQWSLYYPAAERSAGEVFHIVENLVLALVETQIQMTSNLRKTLDSVIQECGLDRQQWPDLAKLNYDNYWKTQYGYAR